MRISFDLDGTFYAAPVVFAALGIVLQKDGHRVGILTGHGFRLKLVTEQSCWSSGSARTSTMEEMTEKLAKMFCSGRQVSWKLN
jgi:hypothetical protein